MNPHPRTSALALGALLALARPGAALAAERGCLGPTIDADPGFRARFPDLLERLQGELAAHTDLDPCARAALRVEGVADVTLMVTLPDGRTASRRVTQADDVMPTLQALLLLPAGPSITALAEPPAASATAPSAGPLPASILRPTPRHRVLFRGDPDRPDGLDRDAAAAAHAPRSFGVELSVLTGARMGDGQLGLGAGALGFLEVHGWLLGFESRADVYRPLLNGDPETALELALLAGRRFDFGPVALDLSAGPAVAMKGLAFSQTRSVAVMGTGSAPPTTPPPPEADPSTGPVPRFLLAARIGFSPRSVFRTFVGVDAAMGQRRATFTPESASARLPAFSLGLALGATVGTP
ncbi:MAG: hypothetical protein ABUL60_20510 [Myxococcales bacterium]